MQGNSTSGSAPQLSVEVLRRAIEILDRQPPSPVADHYAMRQKTFDHIAHQFPLKDGIASFCGFRFVIDENVWAGCVELRDKEGNLCMVAGGIGV